MTLATLSPADTRAAIDAGARLIDIRASDEHARERIPGAVNLPLDRIGDLPCDGRPVVFHCKSGMRTSANDGQLAVAAGSAPAYILKGGIDAWRGAGQPVVADRSQPLEIMRQVQITAGALVLTGVVLGLFVRSVGVRRRWIAVRGDNGLVRDGEPAARHAVEPARDGLIRRWTPPPSWQRSSRAGSSA
jgi:rhodanese-related sulfurtransferase